jgi:hypothetical protein
VLSWICAKGFGGDEGYLPKRNAWKVEMQFTASGVLPPASFA